MPVSSLGVSEAGGLRLEASALARPHHLSKCLLFAQTRPLSHGWIAHARRARFAGAGTVGRE